MMNNPERTRNLTQFRNWLRANAIARAVRGVLPSFCDGDSRKLQVTVDDEMTPRTDGKKVWISLLPDALKDAYTPKQWLTLIFVVLCHELQHINSSNFEDIELVGNWFAQHCKQRKLDVPEHVAKRIAHDMLNIVEDGRIEAIAVVRWPGMLAGFKLLNNIIRGGTTVTVQAQDPNAEFADFTGNILSYAKTGLYAPGIAAYAGTDLEKNFLLAKPSIDKGVAAKTSRLCREAVQQLLEDTAEYIAALVKESEELQKMEEQSPEYTQNNETMQNDSGGSGNPLRSRSPVKRQKGADSDSSDQDASDSGGDGGSGTGSDSGKGQDPKNRGKGQGSGKDQGKEKGKGPGKGKKKGQGKDESNAKKPDASEEDDAQAGKEQGEGADGGGSNAPSNSSGQSGEQQSDNAENQQSPMGFCDAIVDGPPLTPEELKDLERVAAQAVQSANAIEAELNKPPANDGLSEGDLKKVRDLYKGSTGNIVQQAMAIPGEEPIPSDLKLQAETLRRDIMRILSERRRSQRGLRRGALDVNALWKVGIGDDTIFCKRNDPKAGSCVFYILIDNSGSTDQMAYRTADGTIYKYQAERRAAAVIEEASVGLVPCKVVLFDQSGGGVNHQIIRTFDETKRKNRSWNSLTSVSTGGCNADSVHIRIATEELLHRPEQKKVLFVLSDGMPSAYASRDSAETEVNNAVTDARRKGLIVVPIMFGEEKFLKSSYATYQRMYVRDVIACMPQEITAKLCELFRQVIAR